MSNKRVMIWVDHKKAMIVELEGKTVSCKVLESNVEGHTRLSGGSCVGGVPNGPHEVVKESSIERKHEAHLLRFYEEIIPFIAGATEVIILGPGEAKIELQKTIKTHYALAKIELRTEPADKLTENQLMALAKEKMPIGVPV